MNFRNLWLKLRDKIFRATFAESQAKRGIPFQMRAMLNKNEWSQTELAERAGLTQGTVSRALNPNYGNLTINTIVRIAAGFDVAFVGKFVPFSELMRYYDEAGVLSVGDVVPFDREDERISAQDREPAAVSGHHGIGDQNAALVHQMNRPQESAQSARSLFGLLDSTITGVFNRPKAHQPPLPFADDQGNGASHLPIPERFSATPKEAPTSREMQAMMAETLSNQRVAA